VYFGARPGPLSRTPPAKSSRPSPTGAGTVDVRVVTAVGTSAAGGRTLHLRRLTPVITGVGRILAIGRRDSGLINGTNWQGATVKFGNTAAKIINAGATQLVW